MIVPKVSFIIPCYNLAHLLPQCLDSILEQTCPDFEIIIMDDCSPDNTPEVANSYNDQRIIYVRNEKNLKHLLNFNKGITLARGEYIWLISADDCLRVPYILERYVQLMDNKPNVGYVFCPAMGLQDDVETNIAKWSFHGTEDVVFKGHDFLIRILQSNCVAAPCGMVRKKCYEIEQFPLDMPFAGDWYLWSLFALHYDVAYLAEPMVNYRLHELSFTNFFMTEGISQNISDEINVVWRIKEKAEAKGDALIVSLCISNIVKDYLRRIRKNAEINYQHGITEEEFESSLASHAKDYKEEKTLKAIVYNELAEDHYRSGQYKKAVLYYKKSMLADPVILATWLKYMSVAMGSVGTGLRRMLSTVKRIISRQIVKNLSNNEARIKF